MILIWIFGQSHFMNEGKFNRTMEADITNFLVELIKYRWSEDLFNYSIHNGI